MTRADFLRRLKAGLVGLPTSTASDILNDYEAHFDDGLAAGRTEEQKLGMMRDITQALVKNLGVDADAVVIQINEAPLRHKMKGGKTFVERAAAKK